LPALLFAQCKVLGLNAGENRAGDITFKVTQGIKVTSSRVENNVNPGDAETGVSTIGNSGNINIETGSLYLTDGAELSTNTFGQGNAGTLTVKARDAIELIGTSADGKYLSGLYAQAESDSTGNGGDLTIETGRLTVRDGAQVSASTFGSGKGGTLTVKARDAIELIGTSADGNSVSGLYAQANQKSTGDGGDLTIETGRLTVRDGAEVSASTFGSGKGGTLTVKARDAIELIGTSADGSSVSGFYARAELDSTGNGGDLRIETGRLTVRDGALVSASTFGSGKGGTLTVKARDAIELIGTSADGKYLSGLYAQANQKSTGDGGDLTIETGRLTVRDGARVSVLSKGTGNAGKIEVFANSIQLSNRASLNADTKAGGGNIDVYTPLLLLQKESSITTNGTETARGGDINLIFTNGIFVASGNSHIKANSQGSRGGNITIKATSIFKTQNSDITVEGGNPDLNGSLSIDTNVTPQVVPLTPNFQEVSLVTSSCRSRQSNKDQFIITGRGGLPPNPLEAIADEATWMDLRISAGMPENKATGEQRNRRTAADKNPQSPNHPTEIIEAQGWRINSNGQVELLAKAPTATPNNPTMLIPECNELQN